MFPPHDISKLLWLSDLHLERADDQALSLFTDALAGIAYDAAVITGDVSSSRHLIRHLEMISGAIKRPVFFVLGNHDYHGETIRKVRDRIAELCRRVDNLHYLDGTKIFPLNSSTALIGHDGWADTRAGRIGKAEFRRKGHGEIGDFQTLSPCGRLQKMRDLGRESAVAIRTILPRALMRYRHVVVATHVPPFPSAVRFDGQPCDCEMLPKFANLSAGLALIGINKNINIPDRRVTVLAGHTHCRIQQWILPNLEIRVAGARPGEPTFQEIINLDDHR